jgi:hypothetical protein
MLRMPPHAFAVCLLLLITCTAACCRRYDAEGVRRTVDAIILVAEHSHPHVLLLQVWQALC